MKNIKVTVTRTRYFNNKRVTFTNGEYCSMAKIRKAGYTTLPEWAIKVNPMEAKIVDSNRNIDTFNSNPVDPATCTPVQAVEMQLVTEHLKALGFTDQEFAFVKGSSLAYKGSDKETVWIGVKIDSLNSAFIGRNGECVSMTLGNFISTTTFVQRVEKSGPLFVKDC